MVGSSLFNYLRAWIQPPDPASPCLELKSVQLLGRYISVKLQMKVGTLHQNSKDQSRVGSLAGDVVGHAAWDLLGAFNRGFGPV